MSKDESRGNGVLSANGQHQQQQQQQHLEPPSKTSATDHSSAGTSQPPVKELETMRGKVAYSKLPWGVWLLEKLGLCCIHPTLLYKALILILTFCCYTSYHLSRKPTSVVKVSLCPECGKCNLSNEDSNYSNVSIPGWPPFNEHNGKALLGVLDYSWLFSYAIAMYFSGFLSDRLNLRYFLTVGMIGSGICVCLLGVAYFANIHKLYYFIIVQMFGGLLQSTGWPGVVAIMSHWFGKHNRGLIMGVWNSHTSVGNILGTVIPSFWSDFDQDSDDDTWGWSFLVPGFIIIFFGIMTYFFMVIDPLHVGVPPPKHHTKEDLEGSNSPPSKTTVQDSPPFTPSEHSAANIRIIQSANSDQSPLLNETDFSTKFEAPTKEKKKPINFFRALQIPGVVEYSFALFFNKLVSYTFLYWLPLYVKATHDNLTGAQSDWLSTAFDVGGILGGIIAGVVSDRLSARAITCITMLLLAVPMLFVLRTVQVSIPVFVVLLIINGALINGPYGMITTAVSSDLGTHPSLKSSTNAKATVTAIIDGTGSLGAAMGPLLVGLIAPSCSDWNPAFYLLMSSCFVAAVLLSRLVYTEVRRLVKRVKDWKEDRKDGYAAL